MTLRWEFEAALTGDMLDARRKTSRVIGWLFDRLFHAER